MQFAAWLLAETAFFIRAPLPSWQRQGDSGEMIGSLRQILWGLAVVTVVLGHTTQAMGSVLTARQEIDDTVAHILSEAAAIKQLGAENRMETAYARLSVLNVYIQDRLVGVFYDRVQEVRREDPAYAPPAVTVDLGPRFAEAFWDARIATVETAYKNAVDSLEGLAAQRVLNAQDAAWTYLGAAKAAFDTVKDIAADIIQLDAVGVAWDLYQATNTITEQYTAIENAKLAGMETDAWEAQVRLLISRTNKNLTRMKDFKSALIVNRWEVRAFALNLKNIAAFTGHAVRDPAFPLDFSDTRYQFDPSPYISALQAAADAFTDPAESSCWEAFDHSHQAIQTEALAEKSAVQANIDAFGGDKTVYQNDLAANWDYFVSTTAGIYTPLADARTGALSTYTQLLADLDAARAARDAFLTQFADTAGLAPVSLNTFVEADQGIVQMTNSALFGPSDPYVAGRWYQPAFPTSASTTTVEMPSQTPALSAFGFDAYPDGLTGLAGAYRNMAQAALSQASVLTFTGGDPVGYFAASPLTAGLMVDVVDNLVRIRGQALDFETFMDAKVPLLENAEAAHQAATVALQALVDYVSANGRYLCLDAARISDDAVRGWEDKVTPARISAWSYRDGVDAAVAAVDGHSAYIQGQNTLNAAIDDAAGLAAELSADGALILLLANIIGQYQSLPALPSESGYQRFLRNLDQLHAFYGPAQIDRVMDRRDAAIALFRQVHTGMPARHVGTITTALHWFTADNPYCVMPEQLAVFQDLVSAVGVWDDGFNAAARAGFPGWDAWAKARLAADWPDTSADTTRPSVVGRTPGPGSTAVALYQPVRVRFDEAMDPATLTGATVVLSANGRPRQAALRYDTARYELVIDAGRLLPDTVYSVSLTDGATDAAGNPLGPAAWAFETAPAPAGGLVDIAITGVTDGGAYNAPVTIGIAVSGGGFTAWLQRDDAAAAPAVDGQVVSRRGHYRLTVIAGGLDRTLAFTMGGDAAGDGLDAANQVSMTTRDQALVEQYRVVGNRFFYTVGTTVYMDDMLTGETRLLFDAGYYYDGITAVNNAEPNVYAGFLDVDDRTVLFYKNVGVEGEGVPPADKTFRLFVYDLSTGQTTEVPVAAGVSITDGRLREDAVVWIDATGAAPVIYRWAVGGGAPDPVQTLGGLETYQTPRLFAFDGEWVVYSLDDGDAAVCQDLDGTFGAEYCLPRGDLLMAVNAHTGQARTLAAGTADHPIQVGSAAAVGGLAGFVVYEMHKELVGGFMVPISDAAWLYLAEMTTGAFLTLSTQPEVRMPVEMSGSLLYFVERTSGGAYNLETAMAFAEIRGRVHDLFSHGTQTVNFDADQTLLANVHLFGERLVSDHNPPRVILYGGAVSPVTVTARTPADGAADVAADAAVTAAFSGPMAPETFTSETVALTRIDAAGDFLERIPLTAAYDAAADLLTLTPNAPLTPGARYRVWIDGAAVDADGQALVKPVFWTFTTADTRAPVLTGTVPAAGSASLVPGTGIRLRFDEAVTAPAVAAVHLRVGGGEADLAVSVYANEGEVTITPTAALPFGAECTLTVDPVIADAAGNILAQTITLPFRTVAAGTAVYPPRTVYGDMSGTMEMAGSGPAGLISTEAAVATAAFRYDSAGQRIFQTTTMGELYVMDRDGANRSQIDTGLPGGAPIRFTADRGRLLYTRQAPGQVGYQIVTNALAGGDVQVIHSVTEGSIPLAAASPDGARIAFAHFVAYNQPMRLGVVDLGTQAVSVAQGWTQPVWSYDGSRLFARADAGETPSLAAFAPDLSSRQIVADIGAGDLFRDPIGDRIAVLTGDGVQLADPDTGTVRELLNVQIANMMSVPRIAWRTDGARFRLPVMGATGSPEVAEFEIATGSLATMVTGMGMPYMPFDVYETPVVPVPPVRPTVADLSDAVSTLIRLDWHAYSPPAGLTGYRVYRSQVPETTATAMTLLADTAAAVYDDTTAVAGTAYYYTVLPVTAAGAPVSGPLSGPVVPGDNDGLEDAWEWQWFGGLGQTPEGDADGDGVVNLDEWRERTNPTAADTDGDSASDGLELARGRDPLAADAAPLSLTAPAVEIVVGGELALTAGGGSGDYAFQVSETAVAAATPAGVVQGLAPGTVTVTVTDTVYTALPGASVVLQVTDVLFAIAPAGASRALQVDGRLVLSAQGGSGAYLWTVSDTVVVSADMAGALLTLAAQSPAGTVRVTLADTQRPDLMPVSVDVSIARIPGDITGDSLVDLRDAVTALDVVAGRRAAVAPNVNGDADADGMVGLPEALLPLRMLSR